MTITDQQRQMVARVLGSSRNGLYKRGARGVTVRALQLYLRDAGFDPGKADGIFGPQTEKALRAFQSKAKISADGRAGNKTFKVIRDALNVPAPPPNPLRDPMRDLADTAPIAPVETMPLADLAAPEPMPMAAGGDAMVDRQMPMPDMAAGPTQFPEPPAMRGMVLDEAPIVPPVSSAEEQFAPVPWASNRQFPADDPNFSQGAAPSNLQDEMALRQQTPEQAQTELLNKKINQMLSLGQPEPDPLTAALTGGVQPQPGNARYQAIINALISGGR